MRYHDEQFLTTPLGNNIINFFERQNEGYDANLRIPPLIKGTIDDVKLLETSISYEYISDKNKVISSFGLESLVHISRGKKDIYIIDNHNHSFALRWRSYVAGNIVWGSHLIHIDQHSDYAEPSQYLSNYIGKKDFLEKIEQSDIDNYTNEVLTIASFIKPALECGLCISHDMILSEYAFLEYDIAKKISQSIILDIDLDFWAPEMGSEYYYHTIKKARQMIDLPDVSCVTIATSPTYIHQQRALQILHDILD